MTSAQEFSEVLRKILQVLKSLCRALLKDVHVSPVKFISHFSRMRSNGFSFYFGGLGVGSFDAAFTSATVHDEVAMALPLGTAAKLKVEVSNVA